jgi:DNA ligase-1
MAAALRAVPGDDRTVRRFAELYQALDASTSTQSKVGALVRYLGATPAHDAAWAVYFLAGGRPRQVVGTALVRELACRIAGIDGWLFEECYQAVGDLAETIAHVLPPGASGSDAGLAFWVEERLLPLRGLAPAEQAVRVAEDWQQLGAAERFLYVKLIGGGFRVGVSRLLVQRALAERAGVDVKHIAERMMGYTDKGLAPSAARLAELLAPEASADRVAGQPYPFFLAHPLPADPATLGPREQWQVERKYDGIRAQLVCRDSNVWIWSRGEELVTERFPEVAAAAAALPRGTVLDGELLAWLLDAATPAPFALLQRRIGLKNVTRRALDQAPVRFVAFDLLEADGQDLRALPQHLRRVRLEALVGGTALSISPLLPAAGGWAELAAERARSRALGVEGLMLKHVDSRYGSGRTKSEGTWWKWKIDPLTVDGVLIYAQAGHGRRASVYTDYTFAVWNRAPANAQEAEAVAEAIARREPPRPGALTLVPFAKAYSGLTDDQFARVDRIIRAHTVDKFGPVRSVRPSLVFELGFEGIASSARHKSGIAVRFPRMLRIRDDKPIWQADSLDTLRALMAGA